MSSKYNSPDITLKDFIYINENMFSQDFCKHIINEYADDSSWSESKSINIQNTVQKDTIRGRLSESLDISEQQVIKKNLETRRQIDEKIFNILTKELKKFIQRTPFIYPSRDEGYTLLRYKPGCHFVEHCDTLMAPVINQNGNIELDTITPRHITSIIQLNNEYEGGTLSFFNNQYQIPKKQGCGIFFPSYRLFPHQVLPIKKGTRYSIVTFFS